MRAPPWRALFAALVVVVSWLAFDPAPPPVGATLWDKLNHALAFATLTGVARLAWPRATRTATAGALLAYGGFIEVVQTYVPGRSGEWPDLLADAVGIALGLFAMRLFRR